MKFNIQRIQIGDPASSSIKANESHNNQPIVANKKILTHFKVFVLTLSAYCPTSNITKKTIQMSSIHATVNIYNYYLLLFYTLIPIK